MSYTYEHPRPSVTVDSVVLKYSGKSLSILLIKRNNDPYKNYWALPGGFLDLDESPEEGVKRELKEETGLDLKEVFQIGAFGKPDRDPRGRVISICFLGLVKTDNDAIKGASDASEAKWFSLADLPDKLAFDHDEIINESIKQLKQQLRISKMDNSSYLNLNFEEMEDILNLLKLHK